MGKRKSSKKPVAKRIKQKLDASFSCPFCNSANSVTAQLDFENSTGAVTCAVCNSSFRCDITTLDEAIDVYSQWIDECERVNS